MNYTIWDRFMIRTPGISIEYLNKYISSKKDIYEFITNDKYLDDFFKKSLLISSKALYLSYINKPIKKKKYKKLCEGLLKYFKRSATRPTPYGYFANVSLGLFAKETLLIKNKNVIDIDVDRDFANTLIKELENDDKIFKSLSFKFNNNCYVSGDRIKNPCYCNRGNLFNEDSLIESNSIRYTKLVELIKENTIYFKTYEELLKLIKEKYVGVDDNLIHKILKDLMKSEYIYTNLRIPAYCDNILEYIIAIIGKYDALTEISKKLKELVFLFDKYKVDENFEDLVKIFKLMEGLHKSSNYIDINTGNIYSEKSLEKNLKIKIENFVNHFSKISPETKIYGSLEVFKNRFLKIYGSNIEVDLVEIIDDSKFDGLKYINDNYEETTREKHIKNILKRKIEKAIFKNEDIYLKSDDFSDVPINNLNLVNGFDMNFYITKDNGEYTITLGPNKGSSKEGSMFQRFKGAFVKEDFNKYNKIYEREELTKKDFIIAELREVTPYSRANNVINNTKNYEYYISIGCYGNKNKELTIEDLVVGIDNRNKLYIKSKKLNKNIIFVRDNMLNTKLNSKLYQLLYEISHIYKDNPVNRAFSIGTENLVYTPRIYFEGVIISLKKWEFNNIDLKNTDFEAFKESLYSLREEYKVDKLVYLVENDNRLFLNLDLDEDIEIIFSEYNKFGKVKLTELEPSLNDCLVKDKYNKVYVNEFIFSFIKNSCNEERTNMNTTFNLDIKYRNKSYRPFQEGWVYLKLYGLENRTEEFLIKHLEILEKLKFLKWFFIRYEDSDGAHIRIRFKFENKVIALNQYGIISDWIDKLYKLNIINKVELGTYERETNRYGGPKAIDLFEEFSMISSILAIRTLEEYNIEDFREIYFFEIFIIYYSFSISLEDFFELINKESIDSEFRKDYRERRRNLINNATCIIKNYYGKFEKLRNEIELLIILLNKYRLKINELAIKEELTNNISNIIRSLAHMHCNRLSGDRNLEYKNLVMIRHTVYDLLEKKKYI